MQKKTDKTDADRPKRAWGRETKPFTARFPADLVADIRELADKDRRTLSAQAEILLREAVEARREAAKQRK
jgi:hypothetical protein